MENQKWPVRIEDRHNRLIVIRAARELREAGIYKTAYLLFDHASGMAGMSRINRALENAAIRCGCPSEGN